MKNTTVVLFVLLILLIGSALQLRHYYPIVPDPLATHFGVGMQADSWSAKQSFFTSYALIEIGMLIILLVPVFLQKRIPTSMINMPNREYWFAPQRSEKTWVKVSTFALWMAAVTLAFLIAVAEVMFRANLANPTAPRLGVSFAWVVGGFIVVMLAGTLWFYRQFSRIPRDPNAPPVPE